MSADSIRALAEGQSSIGAFIVQMTFKDLGLALAEAERAAVLMPSASVVHDRLVGLVAGGTLVRSRSVGARLPAARDAGLVSHLLGTNDNPGSSY